LADDHDNAACLAAGLVEAGFVVTPRAPKTNMVFVQLPVESRNRLTAFLARKGILVTGRECLRLVTHRDVSSDDITTVIAACAAFRQQY
jgi:threonine aldolase